MTNTATGKKVTLATVKSFMKKNLPSLFVKECSNFDGMQDCVTNIHGAAFAPARPAHSEYLRNDVNHTFGLANVYFVGGGGDYFRPYNEKGFAGYEVSNCCGNFIVAIPTAQTTLTVN